MKTIYSKDKNELFLYIADLVEDLIKSIFENKDKVILGISGGRSAKGIYQELSKKNIPWNKVHFFMIDERLVDLEDDDSNFKLAQENLMDNITIPEENIHPFILKNENDYGVKDYTEEFKEFEKYDIMLLSSGEDGHIGSLYPEHHSFENESEYFIYMEDSPKLPKKRMSASKSLIKKSDNAIILFVGDKKQAYANFLDDNVEDKKCPAKIIKNCNNYYVFTNIKV